MGVLSIRYIYYLLLLSPEEVIKTDLKIASVISLVIAAILLASLLPSALQMFFNQKTDTAGYIYGYDANGKAIATDLNVTNSAATSSIYKLFPLFLVLGGLVVIGAFVMKNYGGR